MQPEQLHLIGKVTRLHGFRGELTVFLDTAVPADYDDAEFVYLKVRGTIVPYQVILMEQKTNNSVKLKLEGVDTEQAARLLIGSEVYVDRSLLTPEDESRDELKHLAGYEVIDATHGRLGVLRQVLEIPGNPQLEIEHERGQILLPLQDEFIGQIDAVHRRIHVRAPEGLIELFLGEE